MKSSSKYLFINVVYVFTGTVTILSSCKQDLPVQEEQRPNIILVITDDQGYGDLGIHDNPVIRTPTIDSLAGASSMFTRFYVSPVCAPTRASLMTGRYSIRTGVYDTYNGGAIMSDNELTMAEYLKNAGYVTGIFGKWHLGDTYPFRPQDQGFDVSYVHAGGGIGQPGDFYENFIKGDSSYFNPVLKHNGEKINTSGYCSDVFTRYAIEFIRDHSGNPFFVYLSFNAPHVPLQLPDRYLDMYGDLTRDHLETGVDTARIPLSDRELEAARRVYGMVTNIDDNLRKLFNTLREAKVDKNTLVIFITDNGPQQYRYNDGMRSIKGSVYEGGIRVPSFWSWHGKIEKNRDIDEIAAHIDILPTLLDICGISTIGNPVMDGISLWPLLNGSDKRLEHRTLFHYWVRGYPQPYQNIAVRSGNFKLVGHGGYGIEMDDFELFDLGKDHSETNDISSMHPDSVISMKERFDSWYEQVLRSENLRVQRIKIGTAYENPVILGRNDTKGPMAKRWMDPTALGYWDAEVVRSGEYDITVRFFKFLGPGNINFRAGPVQRTVRIDSDSINMVELKDISLIKGECVVEAWYDFQGTFYAPILIEIEKKE